MNVKVKICGIKTLEAAQAAVDAGSDFLGFNFVPTSKRLISAEIAKQIISQLPKKVSKVGVFLDADVPEVNKLIDYLNLDYVQLHGDESPEYLRSINNAKIIKTFSLVSDFDVEGTTKRMKMYKVDYFLLDREKQGRGELLRSEKVRQLTSIFPIILSGGLIIDNVAEAVQVAKPKAVDVAAGVETNGEKDIEKIIRFIKNAKLR